MLFDLSCLVVFSWCYFIFTGSIDTIWPMFGIANQLLASIALCVGTSLIINSGKAKYAWVTILPFSFLASNTLYGGFLSIRDNYWPKAQVPATATMGLIDTVCTAAMMVLAGMIIVDSVNRWRKTWVSGATEVEYATGD